MRTILMLTALVMVTQKSVSTSIALPADPQETLNLNYDAPGWNFHPKSPINRCNAWSLDLFKEITTGPLTTTSSIFSPALAYGGKDYTSNTEGKVFKRDIATQAPEWEINLRLINWAAMPGITGLTVVAGQIVPGTLNNAAQYTRTMAISTKYRSLYVGTSVGGILARFDLIYGGNSSIGDPSGFGQPIVKKLIHPYFLARSLNGLSVQTDEDGTEWVYMGLTSGEESGALCQGPPYPVSCGFQSTFNKIDPITLDVVASFKNCAAPNATGCAVWNTPTFTPKYVCFGTGNNYDLDQSVKNCLLSGLSPEQCDSENNRLDSVVCLHRKNLKLAWSKKIVPEDLYTSACSTDGSATPIYPRTPGCQTAFTNGDADVGHGIMPMKITWTNLTTGVTEKVKAGIIGTKQGEVFAMRMKPKLGPNQSRVLWKVKIGPQGLSGGGISFGQTTNGQIACFANINSGPVDFPSDTGGLSPIIWNFTHPTVNGFTKTQGGFVTCLHVSNGSTTWEWAEPNQKRVQGPMSIHSDGVLMFTTFAFTSASTPSAKNLYLFDLYTGATLNSYGSPGSGFANPTCYTLPAPDGRTICGRGSGYFAKPFLGYTNIYQYFNLTRPELTCPSLCSNNHHEHGDDDDDD